MKKTTTLLSAITILLVFLFANEAEAQRGFYIGASFGPSFINKTITDITGEDIKINDDNFSYKIFAGWRIIKYMSFEGGYRNLGKSAIEFDQGNVDSKTDGWDFHGVGLLPLGPVDIFGKAGVFFWDEVNDVANEKLYANGTSFMFGFGAGVRLGRIGIRAEWEALDLSSENRLSMLTAGLSFQFVKMDR